MKHIAPQYELPLDVKPVLTIAERAKWREEVAKSIASRFDKKFQRGQVEHGEDLGTLSVSRLLDEMEMEALDQLAYVYELRRKLTKEP